MTTAVDCEIDVSATEQSVSAGTVVTRNREISLRAIVPSDLAYFSAWADDPALERLVGSEFLRAFKGVDKDPAFFEAISSDPTQVALMIVPHRGWNGQPVGMVRLFNVHLNEGYAYIETIIADPKALRAGFGVQASRLISYYGIDVLGLRRIESKVYAFNKVSINTLKRNNCVQEGVLRKAAWIDGQYWDVVVFGILRDELEDLRRRDRYLLPEGEGGLDPP